MTITKGKSQIAYDEVCKRAGPLLEDLKKLKLLDVIPNQIGEPRIPQYDLDTPKSSKWRGYKQVL